MKKILQSLAVLILLSVSGVRAEWLTDYEAGLAKAKDEKKPVLVNFTGSDWCGWCIKLKKEVFTQPAFVNYAKTNLVLVELDFPQKKKQSAQVEKANKILSAKYNIEGFPTLIVLDSQGKQTGQLGYVKGGPKPFLAELEKQLKR